MSGSEKNADEIRKNVHEGHRVRLRKRYAQHGLENFDDVNALELLLFYTIPRRDTNEIAHALLEHFGSLRNILEASIEELCKVKGVGETTAELLTLIPAISRRYMMSRQEEEIGDVIRNVRPLAKYLVAQYMYEKVEVFRLICVNNRNRVIANVEISRGTVERVEYSARMVVETALRYNATQVILAHNHIGADAEMSPSDLASTRALKNALYNVGIRLRDHIIISGQNYLSMADKGFLDF